MKLVLKSHLSADSWFYDAAVMVNRKIITRGRVDGRRVYFIEKRDWANRLVESTTYTSLKALRKVL